jgi:hypothetical protein
MKMSRRRRCRGRTYCEVAAVAWSRGNLTEMHAGGRATDGRQSTVAVAPGPTDGRRAPGILPLKRSEKAKQLLLKRATEEALPEKTADARSSEGAADEQPAPLSALWWAPNVIVVNEHISGWLKLGSMDTVGSGGGKTR